LTSYYQQKIVGGGATSIGEVEWTTKMLRNWFCCCWSD